MIFKITIKCIIDQIVILKAIFFFDEHLINTYAPFVLT